MSRKRTIWTCADCGEIGNARSLAGSAADYLLHRGDCPIRAARAGYWVRLRDITPFMDKDRRIKPGSISTEDALGALPGGDE